MYFFDPHIHIASRTTDDLEALAKLGCLVVGEPAFWMGYDRTGTESFRDYYRQLTEWEPKRAALVGIRHYAWMGFNAKEAENVALARQMLPLIAEFLEHPNVLGIGEIGLNKNTRNEVRTLEMLVDLAMKTNEQMLFHTPHMADKYQGTRMILDILRSEPRVDRSRVCIDHVEEHTIRLALDGGYWAGITLYPTTKATPERAVDMIEIYGPERVLVSSSADWGPSRPTAVADFMFTMRRRGHSESLIRKIVFDNPLEFFNQSRHFEFVPPE